MQFTTFLYALLPAAVLAVGESCTTPSGSGTCLSTSTSCSGSFYAGYCPGNASIQCCVPKKAAESCSTPRGNGVCKNTAEGCTGAFIKGYCSGGTTNVCCVANPSGGAVTGEMILEAAKTQAGVWYSWGGGGCNGKSKGIEQGADSKFFSGARWDDCGDRR